MVRNNIRYAWRILGKRKFFSAICIFSIAIGFAVSITIGQFVAHEFEFDAFHKNKDVIFRLLSWNNQNGKLVTYPGFSSRLAPQLTAEIPDVKDFTRIYRNGTVVIRNPLKPELIEEETRFLFADSSFFRIFSFPLILGDRYSVLSKPNSVVLSKQMATKYFGYDNPIGRTISFNVNQILEITGVADEVPTNSTIAFDFVASMQTLSATEQFAFENLPNFETFLLLGSTASAENISRNVKSINKIIHPLNYNENDNYKLEPLSGLHLGDTYTYNDKSSKEYINIFLIIGIGIMLISVLNYINLLTSRSRLAKNQIGLRIALGANKIGIFIQYFIEYAIFIGLAFVLGLLIALSIRDTFNELVGVSIDISFLLNTRFLSWIGLVLFVTIILASVYPALMMMDFPRIPILSSVYAPVNHKAIGRRMLILFQFTTSVSLILISLLISDQIKFMENFEVGFNKEQVINIRLGPSASMRSEAFKSEVSRQIGVKSVSLSNSGLFRSYASSKYKSRSSGAEGDLYILKVDQDFINNFSLKWSKLPDENIDRESDGFMITVNEAAVKLLKLKTNEIIGQEIEGQGGSLYGRIAGVVGDFNLVGPGKKMQPLLLLVKGNEQPSNVFSNLQVRFNDSENLDSKLTILGNLYKKFDSERPFKFSFLNEDFQNIFLAQVRFAKMISIFSFVANLLACIGLFGIVSFVGNARMKEIGIRKTMGATAADIFQLLYLDFLFLVTISILCASPIAYFVVTQWTQNFANKSTIGLSSFIWGGLLSMLVALLTIALQGFQASVVEPIKVLKENQ